MSADNESSAGERGAAELAIEKDARERKAAADSLRRQIEELKSGVRKPRSLNELVQERMGEEREKEGEKAD